MWKLADRVRALLAQKTHDERDRKDLEKAVGRQLRTAVLYQTVSRIVQAATTPGRLTMYVLLFPGEGRDNTGVKDFNDKVLGYVQHQRFIVRRQAEIERIFHREFVVVGQDYKTALFLTFEQDRPGFDTRLHELDQALRKLLLDEFLSKAKHKEEAEKLRRVLEKDPDYRFDVYYGTDDLEVRASRSDALLTGFLLLTQALKGAATARYVAKGAGLKVRVVKPFGALAGPDKKLDPRGKGFTQSSFLRVAGASPAIKAFMLKPARDQAAALEYNVILVDTVWTLAFFKHQNVGNRDVIRDVRTKRLAKPKLPNVKYTFAAQKELLELWIVVLNLIDFIKDFREAEFARVLRDQHDLAVRVLENLREAGKPVDVRQAERFLTRDLRLAKIAVLGTTSEFQFYAAAADWPARIIFMLDVRDLGVEVLMLYDAAIAKILDGRLADERLLRETIRSTDVVTEMRRFTHDMVVDIFRRYHGLLTHSARMRRTDGSKEAARAFKKASSRVGDFSDDVQVMLGGDEIIVAAHPRFAAYVHNIVADLSETVLGPGPRAGSPRLKIRAGVGFSQATTAGDRERHQRAHDRAMKLVGGSHGVLKELERQQRRIERLIDMLEANPDKAGDAPKYRRRLDDLRLGKLFMRALHGNPRVLPMRRLDPLVAALREGKIPGREDELFDLVDHEGKVVDRKRLQRDADALEAIVRKKVGRDNIHVDSPPVTKIKLPEESTLAP